MTSPPSTSWTERVPADEAERFAGYARQFAELQSKKNATFGKGRALHRKGQGGFRGTLSVLPDLPECARHGLFAAPATYETWVRLSNGGTDRAPDSRPDIRGFAIKVRGVSGPSALGNGSTDAQDFLLINHPAFSLPTADEFVGLVMAAARGPASLFAYFVKRYGFFAAFRKLAEVKRTFDRPFSGFATEPFFSAAPIACGPFAAKVRLVPDARPAGRPSNDLRADFATTLSSNELGYDLELQFFQDEERTPIENASIEWSTAPFVKVARLTLPAQTPDTAFEAEIEAAKFDPWVALEAHRPLGEIMRARKVVYFESQKGRT